MAIQLVTASDTPNSGRVKWNNNDTELDQRITELDEALTEHQTSGDHNSIYYTKSEIDTQRTEHNASAAHDSRYCNLISAQEIDGAKTFLKNVKIKKQNATILFETDNGKQARLLVGRMGHRHAIYLSINQGTEENPNWEELMYVDNTDDVILFGRDLTVKGKRLATQEYVQDRVRTGWYTANFFYKLINNFKPLSLYIPDGGFQCFTVPVASTLRRLSVFTFGDQIASADDFDLSYYFPQTSGVNIQGKKKAVTFEIQTSDFGQGGISWKINLYTIEYTQGEVKWDLFYSTDYQQHWHVPVDTPMHFNISLLFSV